MAPAVMSLRDGIRTWTVHVCTICRECSYGALRRCRYHKAMYLLRTCRDLFL
jgi:hypothetical protein